MKGGALAPRLEGRDCRRVLVRRISTRSRNVPPTVGVKPDWSRMSARAGGQFGRAAENLADLRTAVVAEQEPEGLLGVVLDQDAVQC